MVEAGGLVIVPTETFYAVAADPFQEQAVKRIFLLKNRAPDKPLPLIAATRELVHKVACRLSPIAVALMNRFWPGSLTILVDPCVSLPELLAGPDGKIGVRVPPRCAAQRLAEMSGGWLTATSANLSGDPNAATILDIAPTVRDSVDVVMDLGPAPGGQPSTVVEPFPHGVRIIREGAVEYDELEDFLQRTCDASIYVQRG